MGRLAGNRVPIVPPQIGNVLIASLGPSGHARTVDGCIALATDVSVSNPYLVLYSPDVSPDHTPTAGVIVRPLYGDDGIYGTGGDGPLTVAADTAFTTPACHRTSVTVNATKILTLQGMLLRVRDTLTINGTICDYLLGRNAGDRALDRAGNAASGSTPGAKIDGISMPSPTMFCNRAYHPDAACPAGGAVGSNGAQPSDMYNYTAVPIGGSGGASGAGGGVGAGAGASGRAANGASLVNVIDSNFNRFPDGGTRTYWGGYHGSSGGGGINGGGTGGAGGGGGYSGGVICMFARNVVFGANGLLYAPGGAGGAGGNASGGAATGGGGGGGGGGGIVVIVCDSITGFSADKINVAGGAAGAAGTGPGGSGAAGSAGGNGKYLIYVRSTGEVLVNA